MLEITNIDHQGPEGTSDDHDTYGTPVQGQTQYVKRIRTSRSNPTSLSFFSAYAFYCDYDCCYSVAVEQILALQ